MNSDDLRADSKWLLVNYEKEAHRLLSLVNDIEDYAAKHNQKNHISRQVLKLIKEWRDE